MKNLLIILFTLCLFLSCEKQGQELSTPQNSSVNERRPDPLTGSVNQSVTYMTPTNWNVTWDTTSNCGATRMNWNAQSNAQHYYLLIQGIGNGSCNKQIVVNGITYYYPWTDSPVNSSSFFIGQVCGTLPNNNYNVIVLYYRFQNGSWKAYTSIPTVVPFGRAGWNC